MNHVTRPAGMVETNPIDGLDYVWIPPGTFCMGALPDDDDASADERPLRDVELGSGFWLSRTEVTAGSYKRFSEKTGHELPPAWFGNPGWTRNDHPITRVTKSDAAAYCEWAGGRLPTEAEWEYAARGGVKGRIYPYDKKTITHRDAKFLKTRGKVQYKGTDPAGRSRPNGYGLHDMAGNVWEWVADWYAEDAYQHCESGAVDPAGPATGDNGVVRGGSWRDQLPDLRVSNRRAVAPETESRAIGFRCLLDAMPSPSERVISYQLRQVDARRADVNILALKYARGVRGASQDVMEALDNAGIGPLPTPAKWNQALVPSTNQPIGADEVLFVGVPSVDEFGYDGIRRFGAQVLTALAGERPKTRTIAMTLHGAGYGLDLTEAAKQQCLGVQEAIAAGRYPEDLEAVVIVERSVGRLDDAQAGIEEALSDIRPPATWSPIRRLEWPIYPVPAASPERITGRRAVRQVAQNITGQPQQLMSVFVAMPYAAQYSPTWRFGIRDAVRARGLSCDRLDRKQFVGNVVTKIEEMIKDSDLVVADLTGSNPNVLLEAGYAWGIGRDTLFLCQRNGQNPQLPFNVRNQFCLYYDDVEDLRDQMDDYLAGRYPV